MIYSKSSTKSSIALFKSLLISATTATTLIILFILVSNSSNLVSHQHTPNSITITIPLHKFKFIAALGDSITAGYGLSDQPLIENRGHSFSIGSDLDAETLVNQFKKYSNLTGGSSGDHLAQIWYISRFNHD